MKLLALVLLLLAGLLPARAQSEADDKYIGIYGLLQQAEHLAATGDPGEVLAAYTDVQRHFQQFQKQFPTWNPNIVSFRLNHINDTVAELTQRAGATAKKTARPTPPPSANAAGPANPSADELDELRAQLRAAQAANEQLQAKVKEALAVQPAAVDPRELQRAQEKIRWLMKENDLLTATRAGTGQPRAITQFVTNVVKVFITNTAPVEVTNLAAVFAKSTGPVIVTNYIRVLVPDTNALEMARLDYAAAVRNFNDEHDRAEQLATKLEQLRRQGMSAAASPPAAGPATNGAVPGEDALAMLRAENARLKEQLAALRAAPPAATGAAAPSAELASAQTRVAALQAELQLAALEKTALQNRLQQVLAATNAAANTADYEARLRDLTQERNHLIEKLDQATHANAGGKDTAAQISALNDEVSVLRSRLAVAEAPAVPFTAEETALFKSVTPPVGNPDAAKKSISEMPAGTAELVASAQSHFVHQEFDAAEADYLKILDRDQNNGLALANLATIELQQGKLDDADKHITAAVAQSPNDAYNLSTLGYLKFRQEKFDDALNVLSRAAQLDPSNPEIQNYLGVTLSHKGQRQAAETALRRAIQLSPNYAPAHNNLAVIYLSQTPPAAELARWHYQRALDAGQPRNPDLEKLLADKGAPVAP